MNNTTVEKYRATRRNMFRTRSGVLAADTPRRPFPFPGRESWCRKRLAGLLGVILPVLLVPGGAVLAADYYVATNGLDTNPGTLAQPFKTIGKAAGVAVAGDTCYIRAGTYRETIRPANSGASGAPITFTAYQGESVVVSGADIISGWSVHSGSIYKAPMGWTMGEGRDQVFVNGQMMLQARYPNTGVEDLLRPRVASNVQCVAGTSYVDCQEFDQPAGFWVGGLVWCAVHPRWNAQVGKVTASTPGRLTVTKYNASEWYPDQYGGGNGFGYITGVLGALDTPTEWHYGSGTLYLWAPGSADPSTLTVEAKHRTVVADLSSRNYIVLQGLRFFAGKVRMTGNNCRINGCDFQYVSHYTVAPDGVRMPNHEGNEVSGTGNVIENTSLAYAAGDLIHLEGSYNTVRDCVLHDADYMASYCASIWLHGNNNRIERNTMYNAARSHIEAEGQACTIVSNDMSECMLLTCDGGALYTYGNSSSQWMDGQGTVIAYNWVHESRATYSGQGLYLDGYCKNFVVHHNVAWNCNAGMMIFQCAGSQIYNNTFYNNRWGGMHNDAGNGGMTDVKTYNNLADKTTWYGSDIQKNLISTDASKFADATNGNFRLLAGSPAIDYGLVIPGITDGYAGTAPDAGAYEYNGSGTTSNWRPGSTQLVAKAAITPAEGWLFSLIQVSITTATAQAEIRYTTDGAEPTAASTLYSGPFTVSNACAVKVKAFKAGMLPSLVAVAAFADPRVPENPSGTVNGLDYKYYEGLWNLVPPFDSLSSVKTGTVANFDISVRNRSDQFGFVYTGYVNAPQDGVYTFYTRSDDGSFLYIGNQRLVNNDDVHCDIPEPVGRIGLRAGKHVIRVEYFDYNGGEGLTVNWQGPGIGKQAIPNSALFRGGTISIPSAPTNLTASAVSSSQINLSWTDNAANETGFKIERKTGTGGTWSQIATVGANVTTYQDTGLAASTTYYYRVRATNAAGDSAYSNEASATTTGAPPAAPSGLTATAVATNRIELVWSDNATNETGYGIDRSLDSNAWSQLALAGVNATNLSDTGVAPNTLYYYRVASSNANGRSAYAYASAAAITITCAITSPANGSVVKEGTNLTIAATASVPVGTGTVSKVEFYRDGAKIGEDQGSPYSCVWSNVPIGSYALTAKATDSLGATGVSAAVSLTVTASGSFEANRMRIGLAGYTNRTETLTNFPALVVFSNNVDGSGFDYGGFLSPFGYDLRFATNSAGTNWLNYEIESWNTNGASYVWVQVPTLPGNGSGAIWARWGDTGNTNRLPCTTNGATWTAGYLGVWHMAESVNTSAAIDSSPARNDGAQTANPSVGAGIIGGARGMTGSHKFTANGVDLANKAFTIHVWANRTAGTTGDNMWVGGGTDNTDLGLHCGFRDANVMMGLFSDDVTCSTDYSGDRGAWHAYSMVMSAGHVKAIYRDGVPLTVSGNNNSFYLSTGLVIGGTYAGNPSYNGWLDEMRVSPGIARSADWIWAEYMNMASNGVFNSYGTMESPASVPAAPSGLTATAVATNRIELVWTDNATSETGYVIDRSLDSNTWSQLALAGVNATNLSDTGLATNRLYYYRVAASNAAGLSAYAHASARTWSAYEAWCRACFTSEQLTNSAISGEAADPDHDNFTNLKEFLAGTNPTNALSCLILYAPTNNIAVDGAFVVYWQSVTGRLYTVQATTNPLNALTNLMPANIQATPPVNVYTVTVGTVEQGFYRVKLETGN